MSALMVEPARDVLPCREEDPELWFAEGSAEDIEYAKARCRECPLMTECLEKALENYEPFGIWGGMTTQERSALRKRGRA